MLASRFTLNGLRRQAMDRFQAGKETILLHLMRKVKNYCRDASTFLDILLALWYNCAGS